MGGERGDGCSRPFAAAKRRIKRKICFLCDRQHRSSLSSSSHAVSLHARDRGFRSLKTLQRARAALPTCALPSAAEEDQKSFVKKEGGAGKKDGEICVAARRRAGLFEGWRARALPPLESCRASNASRRSERRKRVVGVAVEGGRRGGRVWVGA